MPYKIFLSHTGLDNKIAEVVKTNIENAFLGQISVFLATQELLPSMQWKEELKHHLKTDNAIISIITSRSVAKPWIYIEWSAFWLNDKPIFIFVTADVEIDDLLSPIVDVQAIRPSQAYDIRKLFKVLQDYSGKNAQWNYVEKFVSDFQIAEEFVLQEVAKSNYGVYKDNPADLPTDKMEQKKIAMFFIDQGDFETFAKILPRLQGVKVAIAKKLIERGDIKHASDVVDTLKSSSSFKSVGRALFEFGYADTPLMKQVIDLTINHTQKRALGRYIFEQHGEEDPIFRYLINSFTSGAELRNLAIYFLNEDRIASPAFEDIIVHLEQLRKAEQLKNLAIEFISRNMTNRPQFKRLMHALEQFPLRAQDLLAFWAQNSRQSAEEGLKRGILTDPSLVEHLKKLIS